MATPASPTAAPPALLVPTHRVQLIENLRLDDPALARRVTGDAFTVLAHWIDDLLGVRIAPATLQNLLANLPVVGSVFSAFDLVDDLRQLASFDSAARQWGYQRLPPWLDTGLDVIGILPLPPFKQASMGLKAVIRMACDPKFLMAHVKGAAASMIQGSTLTLLEELANRHLPAWQPQLQDGVHRVLVGTMTTVDTVARLPQARALRSLYTTFTHSRDPAEQVKDLLNDIDKANKQRIQEVVATLIPLLLTFARQHKSAHTVVPSSALAKLRPKAETESRRKPRTAAPHQVNEHVVPQTPALATKACTQAPQKPVAATECHACRTAHPIDLATGEEVLHQTDFAAPGLLPVAWTRCYRSSHAPYDHGPLGARWTTPYTTAFTQTGAGLVYHDPDGRNVPLPLPAIGGRVDSAFERFTIERPSATELCLVYHNGDRDDFRQSGEGRQEAGVRYVLYRKRTLAGPALFILPPAEAQARFREHPLARLLAPEALLVITDGRQLWLQCRPADGSSFTRTSARPADAELAALHTAHQHAGLATIAGAAEQHPAAWQTQLAQRIGYVDQLLADGSRHTHVRYRYAPAIDDHGHPLPPAAGLDLVEQCDAHDQARTYAYRSHLLTRYTDYAGFGQNLTWQHAPDWAPFPHRCVRTVADDGREDTRLSYDPWHHETTVLDAAGHRTVYGYNADNLVLAATRFAPDGSQPCHQRIWDAAGRLTKDIDAEGRVTRYTYDAHGNLQSVTDPAGAITRYEYDTGNRPTRIVDPAGQTWQRIHDAQGHLVAQIDPAGHTSSYVYDDLGQLIAMRDARGGQTTLAYTPAGQLAAATDCSGQTTRFGYNLLGHLITRTDAAGNVTRYDTDRLGRVTRVTHADGSQEHRQYDPNDNLIAVTDAAGATTRYAYNGQGQLTTRTDANGHPLRYQYNAQLQLTRLINQNGDHYDFAYDSQGRLTEETGFDGQRTRYRYDGAGQLIESRSGKTVTSYERDDTGRLLEKHLQQDTRSGPVTHVTRYQYDLLGRLLWASNGEADTRFAYDASGHLIEEIQHLRLRHGGRTLERVFTLRHAVDALGNRIGTTLPHGRQLGIQRYGSGHWIGTLWNGSPLVDLERDELHREKVRQLGRAGERLTQTRQYDPLSRLTRLTLTHMHQTLAARQFGYDAAGNLVQVQDLHRDQLHYRYDPVGQLLAATQPRLTETFQFDPAGNLIDGAPQKAPLANTAGRDHAHWDEGLAQLTEQPQGETRPTLAPVTRNLLKRYLGMTFDYDADGNTIKKLVHGGKDQQPGSLTLHYDAENRLIKAIKQGDGMIEAEYRYDAFGRRVAKIVRTLRQAQATGTWGASHRLENVREDITFFVWDGDTLVQEVQPERTITYLYEPDSFVPLAQVQSDVPDSIYAPEHVEQQRRQEAADTERKQDEQDKLQWLKVTNKAAYERAVEARWEHEGQQQQEQFRRWEEAARHDRIYFIHTDQLGTPQEVVSEDGQIVWLARYKAWGRVHALDKNEVRQPLRFQGQYEDEETGLYYNRHRYYDPDMARYLTQDPIGLAGGENSYRYVSNPLRLVDPLGLAPCSPKINLKHIFHGETNRRGRPTGFHHQGSIGHGDNAMIIQRGQANAAGVYEANVGILNPATGTYQTKTSSMFPDAWSRAKTLDEIRSAHQNALANGTITGKKFKGISCSGVEIEGYLDGADNINTAFPKL